MQKKQKKNKKTFYEDVFKHYKNLYGKCTPATLDDFASECIHYNIMQREKGYFYQKMG